MGPVLLGLIGLSMWMLSNIVAIAIIWYIRKRTQTKFPKHDFGRCFYQSSLGLEQYIPISNTTVVMSFASKSLFALGSIWLGLLFAGAVTEYSEFFVALIAIPFPLMWLLLFAVLMDFSEAVQQQLDMGFGSYKANLAIFN